MMNDKKVTEIKVDISVRVMYCGFDIRVFSSHKGAILHEVREYVEGKSWIDLPAGSSAYVLADFKQTEEYAEILTIIKTATSKYSR